MTRQRNSSGQGSFHRFFKKNGELKNPSKSFPKLLEGAESGNVFCQSLVGYCYLRGLGVGHDYQEAYRWLRLAAGEGDADALVNLALMASKGEGIRKSKRRAFNWYLEAANNGSATAQTNAAIMLLRGDGVTKDISSAIALLRKAARGNDPLAFYNLGEVYSLGIGVRKSNAVAARYFRKAAELGDSEAQARLHHS